KLALLEKGLPFELQWPDVDTQDAEFLARSPRRELPVLIDGDVSMFQSSIMLQYIEERWPEPALLPPAAAERARVRVLEEICSTAYDAVNWGISEIVYFKRAGGELADQMLVRARAQVAGLNARLERELSTRPFFNGESLGFGDIVVYPFVNAAASLGYKPEGPRLAAWLKAFRGRPSAAQVKQDILTTLPRYAQRAEEVASGKHKRQYRDHRVEWMLRTGGVDIVLAGMREDNLRFSLDYE
ncbi:MAG: glutathione S-transferase family protein, partial [Polyangiales bacterium]